MATLTVTPANINKGDLVTIDGDDFAPSTVCTVDIYNPSALLRATVTTDGAGSFSGIDEANYAVATLTSTGTIPTANDTVTIGAVTYTFKATVTTTANEVLLGASASEALDNLKHAINLTGTPGTHYGSATVIHPTVRASTKTATTLFLVAKTAGTGGNSLASTEASTQLSFGGANFSGGAAAAGTSDFKFYAETPGVWNVKATDGTVTVTTTFRVWSQCNLSACGGLT